MASAAEAIALPFDDRYMKWFPLAEFEGFVFAVFDVVKATNSAEFILKFEANSKIFPHRHCAHTNTFVVQGDHMTYELDGSGPSEVRPVGSFTASDAGIAHREGGGAEGAIVHYSVRGESDLLFEVLDEGHNVVGELRTQDFYDAMVEQRGA